MTSVKHITRVTLEFVYDASPDLAQTLHDSIIQTVVDGAGAIDEQVGMVVTNVDTRIATAARPMLLDTDIDMPPGGSEATKNAPAAPGGTEQTEASESGILAGFEKCQECGRDVLVLFGNPGPKTCAEHTQGKR